ncbi:hypothetical protein [Actinocorallia populi]|uniref:hypothetical protein n=1 Tax=Actinocorallia populi TaxID=2079200 RepID=UPI0018E52089|nr:hypothetical protein [Actinocorallia populi]
MTGPKEPGPAESGLAESGPEESGPEKFGPGELGSEESGPTESGLEEPGLAELARRQEELVRALVAGARLPEGFDAARVGAAARALRNKRFGEVVRVWPSLLPYRTEFCAWAEGRPTRGAERDGWEFARAHRSLLDDGAATDLAVLEARWRHADEPRRRRGPVVRRAPGGLVLGLWGRVRVLRVRSG